MSEETKRPAEETPEEPKEVPQEEAPPAEEAPETAEKTEKAPKGRKKKEKTYTLTREQMEAAELAAKQLESVKDQFVRLTAEYDNYRKRSSKERESIYQDVRADTVTKFLPVYDNLARALEQATSDEAYRKGVEMIMTQLRDILSRMGVTEIESLGQKFDPALHNAVMHEEDETKGEGEIVQELQKGFKMGDKVIRFAMVKVVN